jgi:hypothetical protein
MAAPTTAAGLPEISSADAPVPRRAGGIGLNPDASARRATSLNPEPFISE